MHSKLSTVRARPSPLWLWLLVAVQVALPASYYLLREDRDDERFAWRMFSVVRVQRCEVRGYDLDASGRASGIALTQALHASWQRSLERGRQRVVERFLAMRCEQPQVASAALERRCMDASGGPLARTQYRYACASEQLTVSR